MRKSYMKYANLYDIKTGECINHVKADGELHDLTVEEVQDIVDRLGNDKDENGKIRDTQAFNNASAILFQMYMKYGYTEKDALVERARELREKQVVTKLQELDKDLTMATADPDEDEYVSYEEVPNET